MRLLELLSGTKSVGKVAEQLGYSVTSLDLTNADTQQHIVLWRILKQAFWKDNVLLLCMGYHIRILIIVNTERHMENGLDLWNN